MAQLICNTDNPPPDAEFVKDLVRQAGVIVVPGSGFGQAPGTNHFRMVFLPPDQTIQQALRLVGDFIQIRS